MVYRARHLHEAEAPQIKTGRHKKEDEPIELRRVAYRAAGMLAIGSIGFGVALPASAEQTVEDETQTAVSSAEIVAPAVDEPAVAAIEETIEDEPAVEDEATNDEALLSIIDGAAPVQAVESEAEPDTQEPVETADEPIEHTSEAPVDSAQASEKTEPATEVTDEPEAPEAPALEAIEGNKAEVELQDSPEVTAAPVETEEPNLEEEPGEASDAPDTNTEAQPDESPIEDTPSSDEAKDDHLLSIIGDAKAVQAEEAQEETTDTPAETDTAQETEPVVDEEQPEEPSEEDANGDDPLLSILGDAKPTQASEAPEETDAAPEQGIEEDDPLLRIIGGATPVQAAEPAENGEQEPEVETEAPVAPDEEGESADAGNEDEQTQEPKKSVAEIAEEVLDGKWGINQERVDKLTEAGYSHDEVQAEVNRILESTSPHEKEVTDKNVDVTQVESPIGLPVVAQKPPTYYGLDRPNQDKLKTEHSDVSGNLSSSELATVQAPWRDKGMNEWKLSTGAAEAFNALNAEFTERTGSSLCIAQTYRSYEGQVDAKARHGKGAATPGSSNHGWGDAIDFCDPKNPQGAVARDAEFYRVLEEIGPKYGFVNPHRYDPRFAEFYGEGSKQIDEPWHWEYVERHYVDYHETGQVN